MTSEHWLKGKSLDLNESTEVIHLPELNQALVLDHVKAPEHIQLIDITTGKLLAKFDYGEDEGSGLEGYSFAVSPQHNYLIVKEITYGESADTLYATIYRLTALKKAHNDESVHKADVHFNSHQHLTFMFSSDRDENTMWLSGQTVKDLAVIDVFEYIGSSPCQYGKNAQLAQFKAVASYPCVALADEIRDRQHHALPPLTNDLVVNSLAEIAHNTHKQCTGISLTQGIKTRISKQLSEIFALGDSLPNARLSHSLLLTAENEQALSELHSNLKSELSLLGIEYQTCESAAECNNIDEDKLIFLSVSIPLVNESSWVLQSIQLISQLCERLGVNYLSFKLTAEHNISFDSWSAVIANSYQSYSDLSQQLLKKQLAVADYIQLLSTLIKKHQITGLFDYFTTQQQSNIHEVKAAISCFDGWDITEAQLRQSISHFLSQE